MNLETAQHSVHPTSGILRVFKHFAQLQVNSAKMALSRPAHQRVTQAVGRLRRRNE
jgi:Rad3-related DNA helicase